VIGVYHSTWPLTGEHRVRPPLLTADPNLHVEGIPGDYQRALAEGDLEEITWVNKDKRRAGAAIKPWPGGSSSLTVRVSPLSTTVREQAQAAAA